MAETPRCLICGRGFSTEAKAVVFAAGTTRLFHAHEGACAELVRRTVQGVGDVIGQTVRARAPEVMNVVDAAWRAMRGQQA